MFGKRRRGQAHTLEGIAGALLVLLGLVFALQVTVVTPLAASTANQHIGNQLEGATTGILENAEAADELRPAVLYWNETGGQFHGSGSTHYYGWSATPNALLTRINQTFYGPRIAYNVYVVYLSAEGDRDSKILVNSGHPADNAISVSRTVTLYDGDRLRTEDGSLGSTTLAASKTFYAPDAVEGHVYNVVQVKVVVWQT